MQPRTSWLPGALFFLRLGVAIVGAFMLLTAMKDGPLAAGVVLLETVAAFIGIAVVELVLELLLDIRNALTRQAAAAEQQNEPGSRAVGPVQ
jgi:hypothetical protein